eukprot:Nk52_evm1s1805 gene=Nk52_evmTU1s1805
MASVAMHWISLTLVVFTQYTLSLIVNRQVTPVGVIDLQDYSLFKPLYDMGEAPIRRYYSICSFILVCFSAMLFLEKCYIVLRGVPRRYLNNIMARYLVRMHYVGFGLLSLYQLVISDVRLLAEFTFWTHINGNDFARPRFLIDNVMLLMTFELLACKVYMEFTKPSTTKKTN